MAGAEASTRFAPSLHISLRSHPKTEPCLCARRRMESDLRPIWSCERLSRRATRLAGAVRCQLRAEQSSSSRSPGGSSRGLAPAAYRPTSSVRTSLSGRTPAGINLAHPLLSGDLMGVPNVRLFVAGAWTFGARFSLSTSMAGCEDMKLKRPGADDCTYIPTYRDERHNFEPRAPSGTCHLGGIEGPGARGRCCWPGSLALRSPGRWQAAEL